MSYESMPEYLAVCVARTHSGSLSNLARKIGVSRQVASDWSRGEKFPSDHVMKRLAERANLDPQEALILLNLWRADQEAKQVYRDMLKKFTAIAGGIIFLLSPLTSTDANAMISLENFEQKSADNSHNARDEIMIMRSKSEFLRRLANGWRAICTCVFMGPLRARA